MNDMNISFVLCIFVIHTNLRKWIKFTKKCLQKVPKFLKKSFDYPKYWTIIAVS